MEHDRECILTAMKASKLVADSMAPAANGNPFRRFLGIEPENKREAPDYHPRVLADLRVWKSITAFAMNREDASDTDQTVIASMAGEVLAFQDEPSADPYAAWDSTKMAILISGMHARKTGTWAFDADRAQIRLNQLITAVFRPRKRSLAEESKYEFEVEHTILHLSGLIPLLIGDTALLLLDCLLEPIVDKIRSRRYPSGDICYWAVSRDYDRRLAQFAKILARLVQSNKPVPRTVLNDKLEFIVEVPELKHGPPLINFWYAITEHQAIDSAGASRLIAELGQSPLDYLDQAVEIRNFGMLNWWFEATDQLPREQRSEVAREWAIKRSRQYMEADAPIARRCFLKGTWVRDNMFAKGDYFPQLVLSLKEPKVVPKCQAYDPSAWRPIEAKHELPVTQYGHAVLNPEFPFENRSPQQHFLTLDDHFIIVVHFKDGYAWLKCNKNEVGSFVSLDNLNEKLALTEAFEFPPGIAFVSSEFQALLLDCHAATRESFPGLPILKRKGDFPAGDTTTRKLRSQDKEKAPKRKDPGA